MIILTELGEIAMFSNIDRLCSFIGLVPSMNNSSDTIKENKTTPRSNNAFRKAIIESTWVCIRHDPTVESKYQQLAKRMQASNAIVRVAEKLIKRINCVLKN